MAVTMTMAVICRCVDVPFFAEHLARYDRQHKMVLEIIEKRPLGLLLIDGAGLKKSLIPSPLKCRNVRFSCIIINSNSNGINPLKGGGVNWLLELSSD